MIAATIAGQAFAQTSGDGTFPRTSDPQYTNPANEADDPNYRRNGNNPTFVPATGDNSWNQPADTEPHPNHRLTDPSRSDALFANPDSQALPPADPLAAYGSNAFPDQRNQPPARFAEGTLPVTNDPAANRPAPSPNSVFFEESTNPTQPATNSLPANSAFNGGQPAGTSELRPVLRGGSAFSMLLLFASIGLNVYLGWIAWDTYNRYQDLVSDMRSTRSRRDRSDLDVHAEV